MMKEHPGSHTDLLHRDFPAMLVWTSIRHTQWDDACAALSVQ